MHLIRILLCIFILWYVPQKAGQKYGVIERFATYEACREWDSPWLYDGKVHYYVCLPESINPNQR